MNRSGRYVRVQLNGTNYLALAEVKVFEPVNLAVGKSATQSTTLAGATASRAADGNTDGNYYNNSVSHTDTQAQPYWTLDLGSVQDIGTIQVWNRTDCCANRLTNFYVFVSNTAFTSSNPTTTQGQSGVFTYYSAGQGGTPTSVAANRSGRYVRVQLAGTEYLALAEVQVWKLK